ncbi:MAG: putative cellulose-binding protein [Pseudomonadota bacterium]
MFEDSFEFAELGKFPKGWDYFVEYQQNPSHIDATKYITVVSGAKVGNRALLIKGGQNPSMITHALPAGTNKVFMRAWVKSKRQLGQNPGANHETLMGVRAKSGDANNEIRFGEIKGVIGTNEVPTDNIAPKMDQWGKGPVLAANTWHCIEVAFRGDMAYNSVYAYANGTLVHSITSGSDWANGSLSATWMSGKFKEVIFGWQSFSNASNEVTLDDVVVSKETIGCDYTVGSGTAVQ